MPIITAANLRLLYGEVEIFAGVSLQINEGDRIGVVGPNGGGKTSLIRILAGELEPNEGATSRARGVRIGYVPQTPAMQPQPTQDAADTISDDSDLAAANADAASVPAHNLADAPSAANARVPQSPAADPAAANAAVIESTVSTANAARSPNAATGPAAAPQAYTLRDEVMQAFARLRRIEDEIAAAALDIQSADAAARRHAARRYDALLQEYEASGGYDYQHNMERVIDGVGLSPDALDTPAYAASGGERTRAALAKALLSQPDFLILDEPTNYLDFKGLDWLESFLSRFSGGFMVVSHDRYFLDKTATQIFEMDMGRLQAFPGNYSKYRALKDDQLRRQQAEYERQQEYIAREEAFIRRYRAGQRAREARGRATRLERLQRIEKPQSNEPIRLQSIAANRTGQTALRTDGLAVGYRENGRPVRLLTVADAQLARGSRTAIVGGNGVGKTTLVKTLLGIVPPIAGDARLGHNVDPGYYSQGSIDLPERASVIDALLAVRNLPLPQARDYLARFLFRGDDVHKSVAALSGGERSRLALARLLIAEPNLLVLDEPTTHLDIPSREALEQALLSYSGALLFVSHDRRLISLLADQLWIVENGNAAIFRGGFDEWSRQQTQSQPPEAQTRRQPAATTTPSQPPPAKNAPAPPRRDRPSSRARRRSGAEQRRRQADAQARENLIMELERRLEEIDAALQAASDRQDIAEVARLGARYAETQARIEQAYEDWNALSPD